MYRLLVSNIRTTISEEAHIGLNPVITVKILGERFKSVDLLGIELQSPLTRILNSFATATCPR